MTTKQELNEATAKALGLEKITREGCYRIKYKELDYIDDWQPTENAEQSMMVLDWLTENAYNLQILPHYNNENKVHKWIVLMNDVMENYYSGEGETLYFAICEAVYEEVKK